MSSNFLEIEVSDIKEGECVYITRYPLREHTGQIVELWYRKCGNEAYSILGNVQINSVKLMRFCDIPDEDLRDYYDKWYSSYGGVLNTMIHKYKDFTETEIVFLVRFKKI